MKKFFLFPLCAFLCLAFSSASGDHPPLHVVTVATGAPFGFKRLIYTCIQNQIHLDVLGFGHPYTIKDHAKKLRYMDKYLETLPEEDLVLFIDGYDVLFLANAEEITERFLKMNIPFLIAGERILYPPLLRKIQYKQRYPKGPTSFCYLNSGTYIGTVKEVKERIREALKLSSITLDDQALLTFDFFEHPEKSYLDYNCELFIPLVVVAPEELHFENGRVKCIETNSLPCIVHGNGRSRSHNLYMAIYRHFFDDPSDGDIVNEEMMKAQCAFLPIVVK